MRPFRHVVVLVAAIAMAAVLLPAVSSAQSLDEVRAQRAELQERLDEAAQALDDVETRVAELEAARATLTDEVTRLTGEADEASRRISRRVRSVFIHGSSDPLFELLSGADPQDAMDAAASVDQLVRGDRDEAEVATAARTRAGAAADELAAREAELDLVREEQAGVLDRLQEDLAAAAALEERLEEEERRRIEEERRRAAAAAEAARRAAAQAAQQQAAQERADREQAAQQQEAQQAAPAPAAPAPAAPAPAAPAPSSGGVACPMGQPHSFTDTWGAPRSGGRSHKGVDILAPRGTPVYAYVSGSYDIRPAGNLAGNWAILRGDDGTNYYYMHLTSHVVGDGARVSTGQQVGTNGDTGNARGTPHLHWEVHPGGGGAVNPTPYARRGCG